MTQNDEYAPEEKLREAIIANAVLPLIKQISKETKVQNTYKSIIRVRGYDVERVGDEGYWRVRLIVRHTFKPYRKCWRAQVIIPEGHETGFRGFTMQGDAHLVSNKWDVKSKGYTIHYNSEGNENWG